MLAQAPSYGSDVLLLSILVITAGVPFFYLTGLRREAWAIAAYVASSLLLPVVVALAVWWVRWYRPSRRVAARVAFTSLTYSIPAAIGVFALCTLGMELGLLGVGLMLFVAGVVVSVSSAVFGWGGGSSAMVAARIVAIVTIPLVVLGLTDSLPRGLTAMEMWCIPLPVVAAGSVGAARGLLFHILTRDKRESGR
jgi:hypothetical protein